MGDLSKVTRDQRVVIRANTWNAFIDAANRNKRTANGETGFPDDFDEEKAGIILVRNDTGATLNRFEVVGLDGILIDQATDAEQFYEHTAMTVVVPTQDHHGQFGIMQEPVEDGELGRCLIQGISPVQIDFTSYALPGTLFCDITPGVKTSLRAFQHGPAKVLWREGGSGVQWAVVNVGVAPPLFPVKMAQIGGSQGTDLTPASWVYRLDDFLTGATLQGTDISPVDPTLTPHYHRRPDVGWIEAADFGIAYWTNDNTIAIAYCNEVIQQESCD